MNKEKTEENGIVKKVDSSKFKLRCQTNDHLGFKTHCDFEGFHHVFYKDTECKNRSGAIENDRKNGPPMEQLRECIS